MAQFTNQERLEMDVPQNGEGEGGEREREREGNLLAMASTLVAMANAFRVKKCTFSSFRMWSVVSPFRTQTAIR